MNRNIYLKHLGINIVLKGQYNSAQGKRSDTLGRKANRKIVREVKSIKEKILFRTKELISIIRQMMEIHIRPTQLFCLFYHFPSDGFLITLFTQGVALG